MRLIDGSHLKKWILQRWEKAYPHEDLPTREVLEQIDREISYKMIDIDPQPQWIPCSKRLPDLDKYVLCTVNDQGEGNEVAMMCLTTSIRADDYYWTDYACEYTWELCEVFAWMPLPDPWEEEEE